MTTKTNQLYFLTHSERGDGQPDGFYCTQCFHTKVEVTIGFLKELVSMVDPEDTPHYRCQICEKDYRD